MGYGGGHIPGHSGTQFKHKKVFKSVIKMEQLGQFDKASTDETERELKPLANYKEYSPRKNRRFKMLIQLPILLATFGGLAFYLIQIFSH